MKEYKDFANWTLHHIWAILASYLTGSFIGLIIHGSFGFTMNDDGTYLSNAMMSIGSGSVLALGTGILQKELLKKYCPVSSLWIWSLIIGFVLAEIFAGIILWKLEIYRGLIGVFNTSNHFPEASIYAVAGLIAGALQFRFLKPYAKKRVYWILASTLGWGLLILSTYLGIPALLIGPALYGSITGFVLFRVLERQTQNADVT